MPGRRSTRSAQVTQKALSFFQHARCSWICHLHGECVQIRSHRFATQDQPVNAQLYGSSSIQAYQKRMRLTTEKTRNLHGQK